jgi:hypothetical protein
MTERSKKRWAIALAAVACAYLVTFYLVPRLASSGAAASSMCAREISSSIANGVGPSGAPWSIVASVENQDDCQSWLVRMDFRPTNVSRGSWKGAWAIPAQGSLSGRFGISAQDELVDGGRVISGIVGAKARNVTLTMDTGERLIVHPKLPPRALRKRFVWLRGLRYFIRFYPAGEHVASAGAPRVSAYPGFHVRGQEGWFE